MGGEQSRPGTVRVPPPSIMPTGGPPGRGTVGGPMFVSPEHLLDLMASGHPFLDGLSHSQPPPGPLPSMVHAQQVRCDAVVDGESLRVTPSPEDPSRLHLDFSFTAHSPVEVGVTYLCICRRGPLDARPLTHPTALLSRLPKSTRRHLFQAGPKQHFSQLALAQGTPSWLILDKEVEGGVGGGETTPSTAPAPTTAPAPAPAPTTAAEVNSLAGEFLDLRQCTLKEVTHRPRSFAGCVDLLPPLTAPLPPIPPPAPQFKLGEAFLPTTSSAVGKKVGEEEPSIPLDMSPILLTLTVLDESGAPAVPTRLQATLATLVPRASSGGGGGGGGKKEGEKEAGWDVKILVQLFQVGSQVYKTQTLFGDSDGGRGGGGGGGGGEGSGSGGGGASSSGGDGGESGSSYVNNSSSSSSSSSDDTIKGTDCVICLSEPRTTALLPCRHLALCAPCAQQLRFQSNKCPICRSIITSLLTWGE